MQQLRQQLPSHRPLLVVCGVSARSAARRKHKQWKQQKKAQKIWQGQTDKEAVRYQVTVPMPDPLTASPPQFFDSEPLYQQQQQQQQEDFSDLLLLPDRQSAHRGAAVPAERMGGAQQRQPGKVIQPWEIEEASGALWVEHRRSPEEQQQYRQQRRRQQQARAKPSAGVTHSMEDMLATSEQVQQLQQEGLRGVAAAAAARGSQQQSRQPQLAGQQRLRPPRLPQSLLLQQQQQQQQQQQHQHQHQQQQLQPMAGWQQQMPVESHARLQSVDDHVQQPQQQQQHQQQHLLWPVLSTDVLWQRSHQLLKAG